MPQQQAPFLEGKYGWNFGESGWDTGMNENLLKFSFMFDGNVDSIVASLPPVSNGAAHFNSVDNRFYFGVDTVWYSSPCPKSFIFKIKSNGDFYQFNGTSAVQIDSPAQLDSRLDAVELALSTLGSAAFEDVSAFGRGFVAAVDAAAGRTALGLGTAATANVQSSSSDTTSGALMAVGAFGIGQYMDLRGTVFETGTPADVFGRGAVSGFARGGPDGLNIPAITGNNAYGVLSVYGHWRDSSGVAGAAFREFRTALGRSFLQAQSGGSWNQWREVFTTGNILGPVSQSGGIPTGAIIERGSNANGEYVRFADGTQICWAELTYQGMGLGVRTVTWQFPATFALRPPAISGHMSSWGSVAKYIGNGTAAPITTISAPTSVYSENPGNETLTASVMAIGRWY